LTDPIVIDTDFKSKQRWRDKRSPYHHQATNLITTVVRFCNATIRSNPLPWFNSTEGRLLIAAK